MGIQVRPLFLSGLVGPNSARAHCQMAASARRYPLRVHPSRQPGTPLTRCCSDGFLQATSQAGLKKGDREEEGVLSSSGKGRPKGARVAIETISPGLLMGKLRLEQGGDCPRSAEDCRSGTLVFYSHSLSTRDS